MMNFLNFARSPRNIEASSWIRASPVTSSIRVLVTCPRDSLITR